MSAPDFPERHVMTGDTQVPSALSGQKTDPQRTYPSLAGGLAHAHGQQELQPVAASESRMWSLFAHLGSIFLGFLPALVIYMVYKDRDPFIRRHSAQALNFQIIVAIAYFVSFLLTFVIIGFFTWFAAGTASLVFSILAAIAANKGTEYTYPLVPKMIS